MIIFQTISLCCFADAKTFVRWKKLTAGWPPTGKSQTSWNQRLMILTTEIPPSYLTINPSEGCAQADHAPGDLLPHSVFKKSFLESLQGVQVFQAWVAHSLCLVPCWGPCNKCCIFLHHPSMSVDWFYWELDKLTQVWFRNNINQ